MRKVHLISVTEPIVLDLALAIREKGYEVTASGKDVSEADLLRLRSAGIFVPVTGGFLQLLQKISILSFWGQA
jgi:hypothetical protein